jgi:hypothetical protein
MENKTEQVILERNNAHQVLLLKNSLNNSVFENQYDENFALDEEVILEEIDINKIIGCE